jgi:hypothetical protein
LGGAFFIAKILHYLLYGCIILDKEVLKMEGKGTLLYIDRGTHEMLKKLSEETDIPMVSLVRRAVIRYKKEMEGKA